MTINPLDNSDAIEFINPGKIIVTKKLLNSNKIIEPSQHSNPVLRSDSSSIINATNKR